jgi:anti-sigma factor RsiW
MNAPSVHDDTWLMLPWLVNGQLAGAERARAEEHVSGCPACAGELAAQRRLAALLTSPERVSYAPGPSLRKLLDRIDGEPLEAPPETPAAAAAPAPAVGASWRPPGLAWAATFLVATGLGLVLATTYRWSQPAYSTYTAPARTGGAVLHIALDRALPLGQVEDVLAHAGARIVEGPDGSGVLGVAPAVATGNAPVRLQQLAGRLAADPRVRWIEPLPAAAPPRTSP